MQFVFSGVKENLGRELRCCGAGISALDTRKIEMEGEEGGVSLI
jgi:hypothetical protein